PKQEYMTLSEFIKDWIKDHGSAHKLDDYFERMQKDPSGKLYMPITYGGAKLFIKLGLSPNMVSYINLILSALIFYGVIMASAGHTLSLFSVQPLYGSWFVAIGLLVLFTGIIDGIDGAIARLLDIKSKSGAWLDNVIDRISDILMLVCLIPGSISVLSDFGFDFRWLVWTNIFLIFIYEYMRARHEGLGLVETKPFIGERITRIIVITTFFLIYGFSSFTVLLTNLINPSAIGIWAASHYGVITWTMLIFQINLLVIMTISFLQLARYSWKNLKKIDAE
ncbi:MAG: CDP-alcohol phosphatidyltransferase family protein, partial [Candidatus Hodarchaeota archaeon]